MKNYTIIDLDNCISDDRHRRRFLKAKDYDTYHNLCFDDELDWNYKLHGAFPENVLIFTGRPIDCYSDTMAWFKYYGLIDNIAHIFMRPTKNYQSQFILKEEYLKIIQSPIYGIKLDQILMAYDDRLDVLNVYSKIYNIPTTHKYIENAQ